MKVFTNENLKLWTPDELKLLEIESKIKAGGTEALLNDILGKGWQDTLNLAREKNYSP